MKTEYVKALTLIAENFGGKLSETLLELWIALLKKNNVTISELQNGVLRLVESRVYTKMPSFAELLQAIRPEKSPDVSKALAEQQADIVIDAVRRKAPGVRINFDDPVTAELMRTRWSVSGLCNTLTTDRTPFFRRAFVEAYTAERKAPVLQIEAGTKMIGGGS